MSGIARIGRVRVLLTGSATWRDESVIRQVLCEVIEAYGVDVLLVHGDRPVGAERIARQLWREWGLTDEPHAAPVDLGPLGERWTAAAMVAAGAELCVAFQPFGDTGSATALCVAFAELAGIPVIRVRSTGAETADG